MSGSQDLAQLRVALFSGNYNYVRDGANQALNRLVDYLLRQGVAVRVYSPKVENPAFEPAGDLVGLPNWPVPGRGEYRIPMRMGDAVRRDLDQFRPDILHLSAPDPAAHQALAWAEKRGLPVLASVHTRFETYLQYYRLGLLEPALVAVLRRYYRRCDALVAPAQSMIEVLREQRMNDDISIWSRGVDRTIFHSGQRDPQWRHAHGIADGDVVVGFLGRLVLEKGLDVFAGAVRQLRERGVAHKVLVVGNGPAQASFAQQVPGAIFVGFQQGADLGRAVAAMDVLLNPSVTEAFGNVTLEAMGCGVPVLAARATGSTSLVIEGETGLLVEPGNVDGFAQALERYIATPELRALHGAAGEEASKAYSWDAINSAVADAYLRLLAARRARPLNPAPASTSA